MDHRITIAIVAVFGGTLAFTFFVASVTSSVKLEGAGSVLAAGEGDEENGDAPAAASPREELTRLLRVLDERTDAWKRDHGGRHPDFEIYPAWEQFLEPTDAGGKPLAFTTHRAATQPSAAQPSSTQPSATQPSATRPSVTPPATTFRRYLAHAPVNPLNRLSTVVTVDQPMRPADRVPAAVAQAGFVYSTSDQCYWGTNGSGRVILTSARPPAGQSAPTAPAAADPDVAPTQAAD